MPRSPSERRRLTRADVQTIAEKFRLQDEEHTRQLRERDDLASAQAAEIEQLRQQIAAAQAEHTLADTHDCDEVTTRTALNDELLREADWQLSDARDREYRSPGRPRVFVSTYPMMLNGADFSAGQLRFVQMIIEHLTANGVMEPGRLFESPFSDAAPQSPQSLFTDPQVDGIVAVLADVRRRAIAEATVA